MTDYDQMTIRVLMGTCQPCNQLAEVEGFNPRDFDPKLHSIRCPKCGEKMIPHTADKVIYVNDNETYTNTII